MIDVNLINGEKMRVEGARIHVVGYEQFSFYAVPRVSLDFRINESLWDIVEEHSGLCISDELDKCTSIDDAAASALRVLAKHAPPDKLAIAINQRLAALGMPEGAYLRFPNSPTRIAPIAGHPYP